MKTIDSKTFHEIESLDLYRTNGFAVFNRAALRYHERKLVVRFSIAAYGRLATLFAAVGLILVQSTNSKGEKVFFWSQNDSRGDYFLPKSTENSGGWGNPICAMIGVNAFCTTNFQS